MATMVTSLEISCRIKTVNLKLIKLHILNGFLCEKIKILRLYITVQGTTVIREK